MTKITLTWQSDAQHNKPFDEDIEIQEGEFGSNHDFVHKVESVIIVEQEEKRPNKLSALEGSAIIVALDDCIEQLSIIKCILNETIPSSWNDLFKYETISERFKSSPSKKQQFQEETYERIPYTDHQKLQKDICFLTTTLTELCKEIVQEGDYQVIIDVLEGVQKEEQDNETVDAHRCEREAELESLKKTLVKEKKELSKEIEKANHCIAELKVEYEDIYGYGKQELRYMVDWENARTSQNELRLTNQEDEYNFIISDHLAKIETESRIHNEIRNFIDENSDDLRNAINYWMQHYDDEIERRDSEIIRLKMIWTELSENHVLLKATYEEHKEFVEERRAINEERRIAAELLRVQTIAAIKIQAWWRGTMVRKKLGPFRIKKGKKGKKGDKGKKGKKKK